MDKKVILVSIDGMRSDGLKQCGNHYVKELEKMCAYTYKGSSVNPSVTLPCHFSMSHSVVPQRHGILTNTYIPQVRPVKGIFELVRENKGTTAFYYGWGELRDITLPSGLDYSVYMRSSERKIVDNYLTEECIKRLRSDKPDFVFLYLVDTDHAGHDFTWMSEEYLETISNAIDNVKKIIEEFGDEYSVVIMADHGGHDRTHGTLEKEDMTIPFFFYGKDFKAGEIQRDVSLIDLAPTMVKVMGIEPDPDWEGTSII